MRKGPGKKGEEEVKIGGKEEGRSRRGEVRRNEKRNRRRKRKKRRKRGEKKVKT